MAAELLVEGDELVLHMTTLEKAEGFHGDIRVPLSSVRTVRTEPTAWSREILRGLRAPGTGMPKVVAVGTRRGGGARPPGWTERGLRARPTTSQPGTAQWRACTSPTPSRCRCARPSAWGD